MTLSNPPSWARPRVQRTALMLLLWATIFAALWMVREVLLPFGVAVLLAYVLHPAVTWMSGRQFGRIKLQRWAATLILYAGILLAMYGMVVLFVPQIAGELRGAAKTGAHAIHEIDDRAAEVPRQLTELFESQGIPVVLRWSRPDAAPPAKTPGAWLEVDLRKEIERLADEAQQAAIASAGAVARGAQGFIGATVGFVFKFFLVLMLTAFMLADVERIRRFFMQLVPRERHDAFENLLSGIDRGLSGVVRGQLTICLVNGTLTLVGLLILQVKFAFLLATVAGFLSLIPIFGSIVSSVPIVAVGLLDGVHKAVLALLWIVGIHALEANFLNPKIMGDAAKIHPVVVVLSLVVGEHFYGFTGALFAVPVISVGLTIFKFAMARALRVQEQVPLDEQAAMVMPVATPPVEGRRPDQLL